MLLPIPRHCTMSNHRIILLPPRSVSAYGKPTLRELEHAQADRRYLTLVNTSKNIVGAEMRTLMRPGFL